MHEACESLRRTEKPPEHAHDGTRAFVAFQASDRRQYAAWSGETLVLSAAGSGINNGFSSLLLLTMQRRPCLRQYRQAWFSFASPTLMLVFTQPKYRHAAHFGVFFRIPVVRCVQPFSDLWQQSAIRRWTQGKRKLQRTNTSPALDHHGRARP